MIKRVDTHQSNHLYAVLAICLFGIIIYSNTLNFPFIFDDLNNITENQHIRMIRLDLQSLQKAGFESPLRDRPMANISFSLNYYFGGYHVTGYHLVNLAIHLINGILVYFLVLILFSRARSSPDQPDRHADTFERLIVPFFAALIFVAHPLQTQSVNYIVQRMNSLSAMFYLLALFLYVRARLTRIMWRKPALLLGCFVSWVMALGSKQVAVTLPVIIFLTEWFFFQRLSFVWFKRNIIYFLLAIAAVCLVAFLYLGISPFDRILETYARRDFTLGERMLTQFRVVVFYISLLLYPHPSRLNLLHPFTTSHSLFDPWTTFFSMWIIAGLAGLAVYLFKRHVLVSFGILWFFANLVVESSVIGLEMVFEHRLYLPMFGFALVVPCVLFHFLCNRRWWAVFISTFLVLSFGTATFLRNMTWKDGVTLWSDVVFKNPGSYRAHHNLGLALSNRGRTAEAIEHYAEALKIGPQREHAHNNLGLLLARQGKMTEAMSHFHEALEINAASPDTYNNLGLVFSKQGRTEEAIRHYYEALRMNPAHAKAHNNLGNDLRKVGRISEAVRHYSEALRIDPGFKKAHYNLGSALATRGNITEAIEHFLKALEIDPEFAEAHNNLGLLLERQERTAEAVKHYSEALRIGPGSAAEHNRLGVALAKQGRMRKAMRHFLEALAKDPRHFKAHNNLGFAMMKQGKPDEAISHFSEALRINPGYAEAHNGMGFALACQDRIAEAISHFAEALRINPDHHEARANLEKLLALQEK